MSNEKLYSPPRYTIAELSEMGLEPFNVGIKRVGLIYRHGFIIVSIYFYDGKEVFELRLNTWNNPFNCGHIFIEILTLLEIRECSDIADRLQGIGLRLLRKKGDQTTCECAGIGHFVKDQYILFKDLEKAGLTPEELKKI